MNIYIVRQKRIFHLFLLLLIAAASTYFIHFRIVHVKESSTESMRQFQAPTERTDLSRMAEKVIMSRRLQGVHDRCQARDVIRASRQFRLPIPANSENPFYRYKRSKVCMCKVPKVASTMLSKLLLAAEYPYNATYIQEMPGYAVHRYNLTSHFQRTSCHFGNDLRFLVVRNPYSRIYSAYIDKILLGKFRPLSARIRHFIDQNVSLPIYLQRFTDGFESCSSSNDVTFEMFLRWILYHFQVDWHFAPISNFCNPCDNEFDVIIKQENSHDEMRWVTEHITDSIDTSVFTDSTNDQKVDDLISILNRVWNNSRHQVYCYAGGNLNYTSLNERFWEALKIQGYVSIDTPCDVPIFSRDATTEEVRQRFKALKVSYLDSHERASQRHSYLVQAYKSIGEKLIRRFQTRYHDDFHLFDYDIKPP